MRKTFSPDAKTQLLNTKRNNNLGGEAKRSSNYCPAAISPVEDGD